MVRCGASFILDGAVMMVSVTMQEMEMDATAFAANKNQLTKRAEARQQQPPQDIPGLEGKAFVTGGKGGAAEYLDNGNLWRVMVQDKQGNVDPELSVAMLATMLSL